MRKKLRISTQKYILLAKLQALFETSKKNVRKMRFFVLKSRKKRINNLHFVILLPKIRLVHKPESP